MKSRVKKLVLCILVLALAVAGIFGTELSVQAGFGDFNDYVDDFDMGDFDFDIGDFDTDWGSDWDSDWSSDGDFNFDIINIGRAFRLVGGGSAGVIIYVVIIGVVIVLKTQKKAKQSEYTQRRVVQPTVKRRKTLPDRTDEINALIKKADPNFTATDFLSFARQVYMDIQSAWENRDLEPVRAVLHQNLYQQTQRQIEEKIAAGIVNHLERISVNTAYLTSFVRDNQYEYLTVYLAASMIDYQVREATGEILYGNKDTRWDMYYKMTFMRNRGAATRSAEEKAEGIMCPNCGAPLKGTSFGVCAYCDSVILTGVYDWVLSSFGVVRDDTVDEGIRI